MTFSFSTLFSFPTDDSRIGKIHLKYEEGRGGGGFSNRLINKHMVHSGTREFPLDYLVN